MLFYLHKCKKSSIFAPKFVNCVSMWIHKRMAAMLLAVMLSVAGWGAKTYTVVIDAGHGGKDAGAIGRSLHVQEKNLNLDVALRLASKIRTAYPDIKVILTRDKDEYITLQDRADITNKANADLFISIHANAVDNKVARGAETFILGTDKMEQNLDVAMRENAVMKLESDYQTRYQGFDPNSIDSYIMFELMQNQYQDQSLQFATLVQTQFVSELQLADRGVRQAAFWVLLKTACPSVLVEMGFVSNVDEEKYLASDQGKREITESLFAAFCRYYDKTATPAVQPAVEEPEEPAPAKPQTPKEIRAEKKKAKENKNERTAAEGPWRVQIFVSRSLLPETDPNFKGLKGCTYKEVNGLYKYMYGACATKEEAQALQKEIKDRFPDCFVVKAD